MRYDQCRSRETINHHFVMQDRERVARGATFHHQHFQEGLGVTVHKALYSRVTGMHRSGVIGCFCFVFRKTYLVQVRE